MVSVSSKGRVVIPAAVRQRLGVRPGTRLALIEEDGRIILDPIKPDYIFKLIGKFEGVDLRSVLKKGRLEDRNRRTVARNLTAHALVGGRCIGRTGSLLGSTHWAVGGTG